jgi:hypothetical protein
MVRARRPKKLQLPPLWSAPETDADQERFIRSPKRISVAATGSKTGKTLGCSIWAVEGLGQLPPGSLIWWIGPYWKTVKIGWNRVRELLPPGWYKENRSDMTIEARGVRLEFRSAENPNTLFGEAVHRCVVDEGPRMRRDAWAAINTTMLQTGGPIRVAGNTDRGKNNWFYELFLRGQRGDPEVDSWSIPTWRNPHVSPEMIRSLQASLTSTQYQALIEAVFTDDVAGVFRGIDDCLDFRAPRSMPSIREPYPDGRYHLGVDLAKWTDYSVLTIFNLITREIDYWYRFNKVDWDEQIERIVDLSRRYNSARITIDSTGAGEPIFAALQRRGVPNVEGFHFSNARKEQLVTNLGLGLERQDVRIPAHLSILIEELRNYEYSINEKTGTISFSSPGGKRDIHDDAVMSLALAYWGAGEPLGTIEYQGVQRTEGLFSVPGIARRWDEIKGGRW